MYFTILSYYYAQTEIIFLIWPYGHTGKNPQQMESNSEQNCQREIFFLALLTVFITMVDLWFLCHNHIFMSQYPILEQIWTVVDVI